MKRRFVSFDGRCFPFKDTDVSRAVARYSTRLHVARLLVDLGLPFDTSPQHAKEVYMSREECRDLRKEGVSVKEISRMYSITEKRVARWVEGVVVTAKKPSRGALPKGIREAPDPAWMGG